MTTTVAVEVVGQRRQPAQHGVAGAELLVLHGDLDARGPAASASSATTGADALAVLAEHDHQVLGRDRGHGVQGVREHAAPAERVQHLGGVGAHPGAGAGGQDEDGGIGCVSSLGPPQCAISFATRRVTVRNRTVALTCESLRRQDSNLNYLNQNQRCCRLHHDGLAAMSA